MASQLFSSSGTPIALDALAKHAEEAHQYCRDFIRQADQKATFFFAACTALIAYLIKAAGLSLNVWLQPPMNWLFTDFLSLATFALLAYGAGACAFVIKPRLKGSKRGFIYFGAISEFDAAPEYVRQLRSIDQETLVSEKLEHVHTLATICNRKYRILGSAIFFGGIGVGCAALRLLF